MEHKFLDVPFSAFGISLLAHFFALLVFVSAPLLQQLGLLPKQPVIKDVYQTFIQVDVVALPDLLPGQKASLDTSLPIVDTPTTAPEKSKEEEAAEEKKDDVMTAGESKQELKAKADAKKKAEAAEKLDKEKKRAAEQDKALKKIAEEAKREAALKALQSKVGKKGRQKLSGNMLSKGTSLTGAVGTAKDAYAGRVVEAIREHFNIYLWQKKGVSAVIHLELTPAGKVKNRQVVKKSNDSTYDSAVLQAVDQASFPVPEDPSILGDGFDITFIP